VGFVADKEEPGQISLRGHRIFSVTIYIRLQAFMANKRTTVLSVMGHIKDQSKANVSETSYAPII